MLFLLGGLAQFSGAVCQLENVRGFADDYDVVALVENVIGFGQHFQISAFFNRKHVYMIGFSYVYFAYAFARPLFEYGYFKNGEIVGDLYEIENIFGVVSDCKLFRDVPFG